MLYQVAALCLLAVSAHASGAVSHVSRVDHNGPHGLGHGALGLGYGGLGWGHGGIGMGHGGIGMGHGGIGMGHGGIGWGQGALGWGHGAQSWAHSSHGWGAPAWSGAVSHHGGHGLGHGNWNHAWSYPAYKFAYSVADPHTGDRKAQSEMRHGDHVSGAYSLVEPDGNLRSVHYSADDHRGFNAIVHHTTAHHHIVPHHHYMHH